MQGGEDVDDGLVHNMEECCAHEVRYCKLSRFGSDAHGSIMCQGPWQRCLVVFLEQSSQLGEVAEQHSLELQ